MEDKNDDKITIDRKRYEELLEAERMLAALHAAGVDNWDGYEFAMESD